MIYNLKLIVLAILISSSTQAFTLNSSTNSDLKGWEGADVKLYFNSANCPAGVDVEGVISNAMSVWNNIPTSKIKVSYGGATTSTTYSNPPIIYCETNFAAIGGSPSPDAVPGAASVQTSGGQISSGVIFLNATSGQANIKNLDSNTLTIVLAHEIGHLLGLGHSSTTNALMYYDATYKKSLRLAQDDMDGMTYLYPSNELKDGKLMGCGLVRNLPPPSGGQLSLIFALMLLPVMLALAGRRSEVKAKTANTLGHA